MAFYTPSLGLSGLFTLMAPFENALVANMIYKCSAIRTFSDLVNSGVDVYDAVYAPADITREKYEQDSLAGAVIVTFESDGGVPVYVPNSYISAAPEIGGVPYKAVLLSVPLAILPENIDLSAVKAKIADDVMDMLGVTSSVEVVFTSGRKVVTRAQHEIIEATRQNNIARSETDYQELQRVKAERDRLLTQNAALSQYIKDNLP